MRLLLALLCLYHAARARGHSQAYRRHMERRQVLLGRTGK